jgi:hypothetical protein
MWVGEDAAALRLAAGAVPKSDGALGGGALPVGARRGVRSAAAVRRVVREELQQVG